MRNVTQGELIFLKTKKLRGELWKIKKTIPLRKIAVPKDIAAATIYMASDELSGHVTGEVLTVSGGMNGRLFHGELKHITEDLKPY